MTNSLFSNSAVDQVYLAHLLPYVSPRELACLTRTDKKLKTLVINFLESPFAGCTKRIVGEYGFTPLGNPRSLRVLSRAFDACRFEGEGENLSYATLAAKIQVVEDRNLIKMYVRFLNMQIPGTADPYPRLWASESELLRAHPELDTCCLAKVTDIPAAASAIRQRFRDSKPVPLYLMEFSRLQEQDQAGHFHDRDISMIPPEVSCFRTGALRISPSLMLISNQLVKTFEKEAPIVNPFDRFPPHYFPPEIDFGCQNVDRNVFPENIEKLARLPEGDKNRVIFTGVLK